jgi:hypothetical protein
MVRVEAWEYWGGYWIVCTETLHSESGPVVRRRLGSCQVPATDSPNMQGMELLAFACEQALDIAYSRWQVEGPPRPPGAPLNSWDSESGQSPPPLSVE